MTITEFLEARIAEDEARAESASISMHGIRHDGRWDWGTYVLGSDRDSTEDQDEFILEWWPARVLAECAAKRAIIEMTEQVGGMEDAIAGEWPGSNYGTADDILGALAAVYADHPDYREDWS